jgi:hypothetical protein
MLNYRRRNSWSTSRRPTAHNQRRGRSFSSSRYGGGSFPWRWAILGGIPAALILLELLLRLVSFLSGTDASLANYQGEPNNVTGYRLRFTNAEGQTYDGFSPRGQLAVEPSAMFGYTLLPNQKNQFLQLNDRGFRMSENLSLAKPAGEIRIFIVGGSTAFGQLSSSNQATFAAKLEARLNQQVKVQVQNPGKFRPDVLPYFADEVARVMALPPRIRSARYRVINAAVPGYSSGNEFMQVAMQVLPYKPDLIVLMNGYTDLVLPSSLESSEIPGTQTMLQNAPQHLWSSISQQVQGLFGQLYWVKGWQYWILRTHESASNFTIPPLDAQGSALTAAVNADQKELQQRANRYRANLQMIGQFTANAKVPLIVALQPELTGRDPKTLTPKEKQLLEQLGSTYRQNVQTGYGLLQQSVKQVQQSYSGNVSSLNLYRFFANTNSGGVKGQIFQDPIHLTDVGNAKLADGLYNTIAGRLTIQAQPFSGSAPSR